MISIFGPPRKADYSKNPLAGSSITAKKSQPIGFNKKGSHYGVVRRAGKSGWRAAAVTGKSAESVVPATTSEPPGESRTKPAFSPAGKIRNKLEHSRCEKLIYGHTGTGDWLFEIVSKADATDSGEGSIFSGRVRNGCREKKLPAASEVS
jgi:hypothetical protein